MYFSTHSAAKVVLAVALATQATALPTTQPPSAVLAVRNAVGQPGFNLEATPAHFRKRSVGIEARDPRKENNPKESHYGICREGINSACNGNMKRDVDEKAEEAAAFEEEADEVATIEARNPRKKNNPKESHYGICREGINSACNGNMKRDVDEKAEEAAAFEEEADEVATI